MEDVLEITSTIQEVRQQLPKLQKTNPVQHSIINSSLHNMKCTFDDCRGLFNENLIDLYKLGFKNEENVRKFYETVVYTGFLTFYNTYLKVIDDFGESSILLPFGEFHRILDEYGLITGPLDRYTGKVPPHVVQAIKDANEKWPSYVGELYAIREINLQRNDQETLHIMQRVNKFPFHRDPKEHEYGGASSEDNKEFGDFYGINVWCQVKDWKSERLPSHLFIAAPTQKMEPLKIIKVEPRTSDPLVCSFVPNIGVVVHTSWGPEGKDVVLNLYRLLSKILKQLMDNEIIQTIFADCDYESYKPSKTPFGFIPVE